MPTIDQAIKRKEKYLTEYEEYQRQEALFHRHTTGKYIGDIIYGANDGIITTFAIVAGAAGAGFPSSVVIILGIANILADGISMGASNYLGGRSEQDYAKAQRAKEEWEIEHLPELEIEEIKEIFEKKGFKGKELDRTVKTITSNRQVWLETMMRDELGIIEDEADDPKKHGFVTFGAFVAAGIIPLLPYLLPNLPEQFTTSIALAALTLFIVGASRTLVTAVAWLKGGLEMFIVGSAAAAVAYFVGNYIEKLVG